MQSNIPPNRYIHQQQSAYQPKSFPFNSNTHNLLTFSISKGIQNGFCIGAIYGVILGYIIGILFRAYIIPSNLSIITIPFIGAVFGGLAGLIIGLFLGILIYYINIAIFRTFSLTTRFYGVLFLSRCIAIIIVFFAFLSWNIAFWGEEISFTISPYAPSILEQFISGFSFSYAILLIICMYAWFHAGLLARQYAVKTATFQNELQINQITDIYNHQFQQQLFSTLSTDYRSISKHVSLGLSDTLRARLVEHMYLTPGMNVCDLMTGSGELWPHLLPLIGPDGSITAVDWTPEMLAAAQEQLDQLPARPNIILHQANACATGLPSDSFDAVVCAFGISTLSQAQFDDLVQEVQRILRPGGIFGFVELSHPSGRWRRHWMSFYLTRVMPWLAKLLGADRNTYLMLNRYLTGFEQGQYLLRAFTTRRYILYRYAFFGGCATTIVGMKVID